MSPDPYLVPTESEAASLRLHLTDWEELDPWPRSVSIAILRGLNTVEEIVAALGVTEQQVKHALRQLKARGLAYDPSVRCYLLR